MKCFFNSCKSLLALFILCCLFSCSSSREEAAPKGSVYEEPWLYSELQLKNIYQALMVERYSGSYELSDLPIEHLNDFYFTVKNTRGSLSMSLPSFKSPNSSIVYLGGWSEGVVPPDWIEGESIEIVAEVVEPKEERYPIIGYDSSGMPIYGDEQLLYGRESVLSIDPLVSSGPHTLDCFYAGWAELNGRALSAANFSSLSFNGCEHVDANYSGSLLVGLYNFSGSTNKPGNLFATLDNEFELDVVLDELSYRRDYFYNDFEMVKHNRGAINWADDFEVEYKEEVPTYITGYFIDEKYLVSGDLEGYSSQMAYVFKQGELEYLLESEFFPVEDKRSAYPKVHSGRVGIKGVGTQTFEYFKAPEGSAYPMYREDYSYVFTGKDDVKTILTISECAYARVIISGDQLNGERGAYLAGFSGRGLTGFKEDMLRSVAEMSHPPIVPYITIESDAEAQTYVADWSSGASVYDPDNDMEELSFLYTWSLDWEVVQQSVNPSLSVDHIPEGDLSTLRVIVTVSDHVHSVERVGYKLVQGGELVAPAVMSLEDGFEPADPELIVEPYEGCAYL